MSVNNTKVTALVNAIKGLIPTKVSDLSNDSGFLTSSHNTDNSSHSDIRALTTEYIVGTQTSATASWTGVSSRISSLQEGTHIFFRLPYASASNATLNLTLSTGTKTGAKNIYNIATTRLGTQYGANAVVELVYDGTYWRVVNPYTNTNYYDRVRNANAVTIKTTLTTDYTMLVGDSNGYEALVGGRVFDVNYPIFYYASTADVSASGTTTNAYYSYPTVTLSNTASYSTSLELGKMVYLVGVLSGSTFTIDSGVFTQTPNTTGKYYIPIGLAYSTTLINFNPTRDVLTYDGSSLVKVVGSHTHTTTQLSDWSTATSSFLTSHQSLTDYVQKSNTSGLLKNDGTVDTTTYLSSHQDISGKSDKVGSLSDLQNILSNASSGDVIRLSSDYVYDATVDSGLTDLELKITTPVTIYGNGHTIDFDHVARGLDILGDTSSTYTIIYDVTFRKAYGSNDDEWACIFVGAGAYANLTDCTLLNNSVGVYNMGACILTDCIINGDTGVNNEGDCSLTRCTIKSHNCINNYSTCSLTDCTIHNSVNGIYNYSDSTCSLTNCTIYRSTIGLMNYTNATCALIGGTITDNQYGVVNLDTQNRFTINESQIYNNTTNVEGEVTYIDNNNHHSHTTSDLSDWSSATSSFLTSHQSLTDYVQKSNTSGLLKNDGSVDTSTYLTSHQSLSGYLQSSDIVDNLSTDNASKVLSAKQGKVLNDLIGDAIEYINQ